MSSPSTVIAIAEPLALEHPHDRLVGALDRRHERLAGSAVLQHAGHALVHDVADAADEHRDEGLELVRHPIGDEVLERDGVHQLVGEERGERLVHLRVEQRLVDGLGHRLGVEDRAVRPHPDDAGEHADHADDAEQHRQDRSGDAPWASSGGRVRRPPGDGTPSRPSVGSPSQGESLTRR